MKEIKVSVIIPVYNSEKTIENTIKSILSQTAVANILEIIIVNDGSTDNSNKVIESISKISKVPMKIINQKNQGVSVARNKGVQESNARWIAFCDSDDVWSREKLAIQLKCLKENEISFLGTGLIGYNPKIGKLCNGNLYSLNIKQLLTKTWPQTSTVILEKSIFEKCEGFPEKQKYAEDGNLWIKCLQLCKIYYIREELVNYGNGKEMFGSVGLSSNIKEMHLGVLKNIHDAYSLRLINAIFFFLFTNLEKIKYLRRVVITKLNK